MSVHKRFKPNFTIFGLGMFFRESTTFFLVYFSKMMEMNPRKFEDEVAENLELDDEKVLTKRVQSFTQLLKARTNTKLNLFHSKSQWTRIHDGVQEHFSSHVLINGSAYHLPSNVYALKQSSKQSWMLYKKRECERRKRLRVKLEKEQDIEKAGGPANILLSMVDACESCKKLYITVNLFWGVTLCDICYFNPEVINVIMNDRKHEMKNSSNDPFKIVEKVLAKPTKNSQFFKVTSSSTTSEVDESGCCVVNIETLFDDIVVPTSQSPENVETISTTVSEDIRPVSTYVSSFQDEKPNLNYQKPSELFDTSSDEECVKSYSSYFSQPNFLNEEDIFSD
jgi:hypothetical protein